MPEMCHLRRGDALQSDMDATDHDGVTVDDVGAPDQTLTGQSRACGQNPQ
jgi:hypothetical protein